MRFAWLGWQQAWTAAAIVAPAAIASTAATGPGTAPLDCFPPDSAYTAELCCAGGGLADCFAGDFTFRRCCPGAVGTDPDACFETVFEEEACCAGRGLDRCFLGRGLRTRRACCTSDWAPWPESPFKQAAWHAYDVARSGDRWLPIDRPKFFVHLLGRLGIAGPCIEVGVQRGNFSQGFLQAANRTRRPGQPLPRYYMVDAWEMQASYDDCANQPNERQKTFLQDAIDKVAPFWDRVSLMKLYSREAATHFRDGEAALVYLDARHDYCSVMEDMTLWYPKVRPGGLLGGDDWVPQAPGEWEACENGTRVRGGVVAAVRDFVQAHGLSSRLVTARTQWVLQKPTSETRMLGVASP